MGEQYRCRCYINLCGFYICVEYEEAKEWVEKQLSFNVDNYVNLFEITIRNLGALLATYHLTGDDVMKTKAVSSWSSLLNFT